jgi:Leucine-rich repeat (LRR) protein
MVDASKLVKDGLKKSLSTGADVAKTLPEYSLTLKIVITVLKHAYELLQKEAESEAATKDQKKLAAELRALDAKKIREVLDESWLRNELVHGQAELEVGVGLLVGGQERVEQTLAECLARLGEIAEKSTLGATDLHGAILACLPELQGEALEAVRSELASIPLLIEEGLRQAKDAEAIEFERRYLKEVAKELGRLDVLGLQSRDPQVYPLDSAWISLTVTGGRWNRLASSAAEEFLLANPMAAIRGAAGSGKTTVLQWLATQCAAAPTMDAPNPWYGQVPFLIRLRKYKGGNDIIPSRGNWIQSTLPRWSDAPPPGWVDDALNRGRAILLVDGVDELAASRRERLWKELHDLAAYGIRIYVTSRNLPHDTKYRHQWNPIQGMADAEIRDLTDDQVGTLIHNWHVAMAKEANRRNATPEEIERIESLEAPLRERLRMPEHRSMRSLASTPLLCAAICLVNRENEGHPVQSECDLFERCCAALVLRRDERRGIGSDAKDGLEYTKLAEATEDDWLELHSRVAFAMLANPSAEGGQEGSNAGLEADYDDVARWVKDAAQPYPELRGFIDGREQRRKNERGLPSGAEALLQHMQERRSLIREVGGQYDFHHRTLRDYLAARAVPLLRYRKQLLDHIGDDRWREVIRLFPGTKLAGVSDGDWLIKNLLAMAERARVAKRKRMRAAMLVIACQATRQGNASPDDTKRARSGLRAAIEKLDFSLDDAAQLATLGDEILPLLRLTKTNLKTERRSLAAARVLRLVDTDGAADMAVKALGDTKHKAVREEMELWELIQPLRLSWIVVEVQHLGQEDRPVFGRIRDLDPLSGLTELQMLNVSGTQVSDLVPLTGLTQLESLGVSGTQVSDLGPLSGLTQLGSLDVSETQVSDLGPLTGLTELRFLHVSGTQVSDLGPLTGLTQLRTLSVSGTQVSDLGPLTGLTQLRTLSVSGTQVSDLGPLSGLTQLESLYVSGTQVSDLGPLSGLTELRFLHVSGTQVSDLGPLSELTQLWRLDVSGTQVSDLGPLSGLTQLGALEVSGTQVSDLVPLTGLTQLESLGVSGTQVSNLGPLSGLTQLWRLDVSGTQVSDLGPLSGLTQLDALDVRNTHVSNLEPLGSLSQVHVYVSAHSGLRIPAEIKDGVHIV